MSLTRVPNESGFEIVGEVRAEELTERLLAANRESPSTFEDRLFEMRAEQAGTLQGYECSACGRWAIQMKASDPNVVLWLRPDIVEGSDEPIRLAPVLNRRR